ncbi:MAG: hypothetical protein O3B86_11485, partial [Planctomycetota bacterium]|nr:hypothetical protein [Planctomycetota bacterium]
MKKKGKLTSFQPTRSTVSGVIDALKAVANKPSSLESPCWLNNGPEQIIAFDNGLLDVENVNSRAEISPHTPRWFSPNCLPHKFDSHAEC